RLHCSKPDHFGEEKSTLKKIVAELAVARCPATHPRRDVFHFCQQVSIRCATAPLNDIFDNLTVDARQQHF
ncbi:hypothetical protein, partial [uncultured Roseicyclus sp.]|uniref:hypothetical protein n=1 Tax=uncultured Roseicyclus sp. TaxID=543072 RepID=UPI00260C34D7